MEGQGVHFGDAHSAKNRNFPVMSKAAKYTLLAMIPLLLLGLVFFVPGLPGYRLIAHADKNGSPLAAETLEFHGQSYDVIRVDPRKQELRLYWKDGKGQPYGSFDALREGIAKDGKTLRFAMNAGIFSEDRTPGGLHIEDGNVLKTLNLKEGVGNFHLKPNGVFLLGAEGASVVESETYSQSQTAPMIATQSGPMLVIDGELHPAFREGSENKNIRNGVGVDSGGNIWFVISNERVNFFDFGSLFRDKLGCPDALYLDGAISAMYLPELDRNDVGFGFCGILAVVE
jgi:uncharacterized protein YigE (DUF2233 family)